MQRMNLLPPSAPVTSASPSGLLRAPGAGSGALGRFIGHFTIGKSNKTAPGSNGPIARALRKYDLAAATQALDKAGSPPHGFFASHHLDQLVGMLALNDTEKLDAWHESGALDPSWQPTNMPGVKSFLKQFPYVTAEFDATSKPIRSAHNLNSEVNFKSTQKPVLCRHLAIYWLTNRPLPDGKFDYRAFNSKENLEKSFSDQNYETFNYYTRNCKESHLVENDDWGKFLTKEFVKLQQPDSASATKRILLLTNTHAMACELKLKDVAGSNPAYVLNFYDPNCTATHRRLRTQDLAGIESVTMEKQMYGRHVIRHYYKDLPLSFAFTIPDDMRKPPADYLPYLHGEPLEGRRFMSRPAQKHYLVNPGYLMHVMGLGFSGELPAIFAAISRLPDSDSQVTVLSSPSEHGLPPLVQAMADQLDKTTSKYTTCVLEMTTLSPQEKIRVLTQWVAFGSPALTGLQIALGLNCASVVRAFTRTVLASNALTAAEKRQVLNVRMVGKDEESTLAFIEEVMQSNMEPAIRDGLLEDFRKSAEAPI